MARTATARKQRPGVLATDLPGITTVLDQTLHKGGLPIWAAREAGKAIGRAILSAMDTEPWDDWHERITAIAREAIADGWKYADRLREKAAARGTDGHAACERIEVAHSDDDVAEILRSFETLASEDVYLMALAFRNWLIREQPVILRREFAAACVHCGYGATIDLEWRNRDGGEWWVTDIKTGKDVYDSAALQVVGQIHAIENTGEHWQLGRSTKWNSHRYEVTGEPDEELADHYKYNASRRAGILWIAPNADKGCELIEVPNEDRDLEAFLHTTQLYHWRRQSPFNRRA